MKEPTDNPNQTAARPVGRMAGFWRELSLCLLSGAMLLVAGCQSAPPPNAGAFPLANQATTTPNQFDPRTVNYATNLLQEGDVVNISFQLSTNFNAVQKITLDGMLNLESVPPIKAAGKTVVELQAELARLYKPQIKDDVVTVKLVVSANSVYLSGAVIRPGKILMERPMTALEAIMEAGGFDPNRAKLTAVTVLRLEDGKQKTYRLNLKKTLQGDDEVPFYLRPFDVVHVPTKTFNF